MKQVFSYLRPHDLGGTFKKFWKLLLLSAAQASYIFAPLLGAHSRISEVILDAASKARDLRNTLVCSDRKVAQERPVSTEAKSSQQETDLEYLLLH